MAQDLLLEIGLEEIPARFIPSSEQQLADRVTSFLDDHRLTYQEFESFSSPRRLAVLVRGVADKQEDVSEEVRGPARRIAQDEDGEWTKAAQGFVRGQSCDLSDIFFKEEKGEDYVFVNKFTPGQSSLEVLKGLDQVVKEMTFPVTMRWADHDFEYIRPIHWIVALLGDQVIPFQVLDVESGRQSSAHRFLGEAVTLDHPNQYEEKLQNEYVIARRDKRQEMILSQIKTIEANHDVTVSVSQDLLDEVTDMVEFPTAFLGSFKQDYLSLPEEVLVTSMKDHQRYFSVTNEEGDLQPYFVSVRNGTADHIETVVKGNEKVISARLDDALFFYQEDLDVPIETYLEKLERVSFYQGLGSMADKVKRVRIVAKIIGQAVGLSDQELVDLDRAAQLSKFDLSSLMVNEFPELQGVMGAYYAREAGENEAVCQGIREHYMPTSAHGDLPESDVGAVLAVADKLDSVMMFFAADQIPTGSNDPFALRRQAYGVLRIFLDKHWDLNMLDLMNKLMTSIPYPSEQIEENAYKQKNAMLSFIKNRIRQYLEGHQTKADVIEAILASSQDDMRKLVLQAKTLMKKRETSNYTDLVETLSRVINLREKALESLPKDYQVDESALDTDSEKQLYQAVDHLPDDMKQAESSDEVYQLLEKIAPTIQDFFDENLVMHEDDVKRFNRLQILLDLSAIILSFAYVNKLLKK